MRREERGLTLPELLITIMLLSVLMTIVITVFVQFNRTFTDSRMANENTAAASIAMNEVTRVVRSGTENPVVGSAVNQPVFAEARPRKVVLQSYLDTSASDPRPVKVSFEVTPSRDLVEVRWAALPVAGNAGYFAYSSTESSRRVVARKIVLPTGGEDDIFTFVDKNGAKIAVPSSGQLTQDQRRAVVAVQVRFRVQTDERGLATPATLQNTVGIPNLGVSRVQAG